MIKQERGTGRQVGAGGFGMGVIQCLWEDGECWSAKALS